MTTGIARDSEITFARHFLTEAIRKALEEEAAMPGFEDAPLFDTRSPMDDFELRGLLEDILSEIRNRGLSIEEVLNSTNNQPDANSPRAKTYRQALMQLVYNVNQFYEEAKVESQTYDANDLLLKAVDILTPHPALVAEDATRSWTDYSKEILNQISQRYRYLFIDEFQDTDYTQKQLIDALIGQALPVLQGVFVVGDTKQSIYQFRGANVSFMTSLAQERGVELFPLSTSWRSTKPLLRTQNGFFKSVGENFSGLSEPLKASPNALVPKEGPPSFIYVNAGENKFSQPDRINATALLLSRFLGQEIELNDHNDELYKGPLLLGHIVLLTRTNAEAKNYAEGLTERGIEAKTDKAVSFYRQEEIVALYRLLRLLLRYPDDTTLALALDTPYLSSVDASEKIRDMIQYKVEGESPLLSWVESKYPNVKAKLDEIRASIRTDTVPQLLSRIYDTFDLESYYRTRRPVAIQNLERLREIARALFQEEQAMTLRLFTDILQSYIATDRDDPASAPEENPCPSYVRVMTIHRAKGLEFPVVVIPEIQRNLFDTREENEPPFLVTEEDGLEVKLPIPDLETRSPRYWKVLDEWRTGSLEEEMRVLYVAVTRAKNNVFLIGSGPSRPNPYPGNDLHGQEYSWRDEILIAKNQMQLLGDNVLYLRVGNSGKLEQM